jgi:RNA polymerase sigma-70 factor (ECF subfamily)
MDRELLGPGLAIVGMQPAVQTAHDGAMIAESYRRPELFRVLFDRHYERVRRYACARLGAGGEDIAADVFAVAFACRGRYDVARADAAPWLLGIATNLIRRQHRAERHRLRLLAALSAERSPDPVYEGVSQAVARALERLARRDRDVLVLYAIGELSYAEIAQAMGIAEGTVRSRLHRARRILKEAIEL